MISIVAELGVNWEPDSLPEMIRLSKDTGADFVKFQAFKADHVKGHPLARRLLASAVTKENVSDIAALCKGADMPWFCTPFYPEAVDFLDSYVDRYKVREKDARVLISSDGSASPVEPSALLRRVMDTGKLVYMSVQRKPLDMHWLYHPRISWLYCKPSYPAALEDLELWKCAFGYGLSCHTPEPTVPVVAAALMARWSGEKAIEVHVGFPGSPDEAVSFSFGSLKEIVRDIRAVERMSLNERERKPL